MYQEPVEILKKITQQLNKSASGSEEKTLDPNKDYIINPEIPEERKDIYRKSKARRDASREAYEGPKGQNYWWWPLVTSGAATALFGIPGFVTQNMVNRGINKLVRVNNKGDVVGYRTPAVGNKWLSAADWAMDPVGTAFHRINGKLNPRYTRQGLATDAVNLYRAALDDLKTAKQDLRDVKTRDSWDTYKIEDLEEDIATKKHDIEQTFGPEYIQKPDKTGTNKIVNKTRDVIRKLDDLDPVAAGGKTKLFPAIRANKWGRLGLWGLGTAGLHIGVQGLTDLTDYLVDGIPAKKDQEDHVNLILHGLKKGEIRERPKNK